MAIAAPVKGPKYRITATAASAFLKIGDASDDLQHGGWIVQLVDIASLSASLVVKAQCLAVTRENVADQLLAIKYRGGNVNGTAADWSYVSTALTTNSLIFIPAGGMTVGLDMTYTSGTGAIYITPVIGSCAF